MVALSQSTATKRAYIWVRKYGTPKNTKARSYSGLLVDNLC